jgi:hypothetical protein
MAVLAGRLEAGGRQVDAQPAEAELSTPTPTPTRYQKIAHDPAAIERLLVTHDLLAHPHDIVYPDSLKSR